jgi:hypothetical protein
VSDIAFADALRAAAALGPLDADARDQLLEMLGLTRTTATTTAAPAAIGVWQPSSTEVATRPASPAIAIEPRVQVPARQDRVSPREGEKLRRTVVTEIQGEQTTAALPSWLLTRGDPLEPADARPTARPPTERLFSSLQERAMLTAALSTVGFDGDLDIEGIVEILASGQPLTRVPRVAAATVRRGVQVLVDASAALDPYRSDIEQLLVSFDALLADNRLQMQSFFGCPGRGVFSSGDTLETWTPPPPGTLVAIVSDFGIGGPLIDDEKAAPTEWLAFIGRVRRGGHPTIGFVPYEARRWPTAIARSLTLIHWSERTTVGEIRRALRETYRA